MEVKLDKRYDLAVSAEQAWQVLCDIHAVARCMPGAQITEQLDATHYKGTVKSKVGPAVMQFGGDIEVLGLDAATKSMQMLGKGADKSGSSASMDLKAHLEAGVTPGTSVLVGVATIIVSGKLAQFGSRLLVPVSDAMLTQFADNFRAAAAAIPAPAPEAAAVAVAVAEAMDNTAPATALASEAPVASAAPLAPRAPVAFTPAPVKELNALALMWTVFKGWLAGLFGGKRA
jgi:carbon monoxide dehydrogenase subunit G